MCLRATYDACADGIIHRQCVGILHGQLRSDRRALYTAEAFRQ